MLGETVSGAVRGGHDVGTEMERGLLAISRRDVVHLLVRWGGQLFYRAPGVSGSQ